MEPKYFATRFFALSVIVSYLYFMAKYKIEFLNYLNDRIGERISVKMIQEIERIYDPTKNEKNELDKFVYSKIIYWDERKVYTTDVLDDMKEQFEHFDNVSSRKLIESVRKNAQLFGLSYNPFRYPKRGFTLKKVKNDTMTF